MLFRSVYGSDGPIIIISNQYDGFYSQNFLSEINDLKAAFSDLSISFIPVKARTGEGIEHLKEHIRDLVWNEANRLYEIIEWKAEELKVKDKLEELEVEENCPLINFDVYLELCKENKIGRIDAENLMLNKFNRLGMFLWFDPYDHSELSGYILVRPKWAKEAIYQIFDSFDYLDVPKNLQGLLQRQDLLRIWNDHDVYPDRSYTFLIKLMEKYQLICEIGKNLYEIPQLLPVEEMGFSEWNEYEALAFEYRYEQNLSIESDITAFVTLMNNYVASSSEGQRLRWKHGVFIQKDNNFIKVVGKPSTNRIVIKVIGADKKIIFDTTLTMFDTIFKKNLKVKVSGYKPCNCHVCINLETPKLFDYSELGVMLESKEKTVFCPKSKKHINLRSILEGQNYKLPILIKRLAQICSIIILLLIATPVIGMINKLVPESLNDKDALMIDTVRTIFILFLVVFSKDLISEKIELMNLFFEGKLVKLKIK